MGAKCPDSLDKKIFESPFCRYFEQKIVKSFLRMKLTESLKFYFNFDIAWLNLLKGENNGNI